MEIKRSRVFLGGKGRDERGETCGGGGKGKGGEIFLHNICCIEYIHVDVFNGCV